MHLWSVILDIIASCTTRIPVSDCMTLISLPRLFWSKGEKETSKGPVTADVICSDCKERLYY